MAEGTLPDRVSVVLPNKSAEETRADQARQRSIEEFLTVMRERFMQSRQAEEKLRSDQVKDLEFYRGDQWPSHLRSQRDRDSRPTLTINRLPSFVRIITNAARQARPAIAVNPVDDGADPDTAEVLQGLIRQIERSSYADQHYNYACEQQAIIGRGWLRVLTEWENDHSFDQICKISRVANPFCVYPDPSSIDPLYVDGRYAFITQDMPKKEFRALYGDEEMATCDSFYGRGDTLASQDWMPEGKVRIAEYFYIEEELYDLLLVTDGEQTFSVRSSLFDKGKPGDGLEVLDRRKVRAKSVKWAKVTGCSVLQGNEEKTRGRAWPGTMIPLVPVIGEETTLDGQRDYRGLVRDAIDPQRMYDFWTTALTETIALAPKAPWLISAEQIADHETMWQTANTANHPYLLYKTETADGHLVPAPQRQTAEPAIRAITSAIFQADTDLKAVTGINDATLGTRGPAESGKAIGLRQQQGEAGNSHYLDNQLRSIRRIGSILLDMIPNVYSRERIVRIVGDDEGTRQVMIDPNAPPDANMQQLPPGVDGVYRLDMGHYDVTVSSGPSFETRRREAVASLVDFVKAYPDAFPVIGDIIAGYSDWPGAKEAQKRLRAAGIRAGTIPPDEGALSQVPAEVQAQIQQMQQEGQQLQQQLQQAQFELKTDKARADAQIQAKQLDGQTKERIESLRVQSDMMLAQAKLSAERDTEEFKAEMERMSQMIQQLHESAIADDRNETTIEVAEIHAEANQAARADNKKKDND